MKYQRKLDKKQIDPHAVKLVGKLQNCHHTAYLVGGCVRDLLLGLIPKDFDIVTSAFPRQVNRLIRPSYIIGRRFKLVLVPHFGKQYEISTFRGKSLNEDKFEGPIKNDNTFGTAVEDARRRDFSINSFFYDPVKYELIDYCGGLKDIEDGLIRMIGDPVIRIQEDPLRMLRALRFAHKTNFAIEESLREAIRDLASQLKLSVLPRRREELLKFLRLKTATRLLIECHDLDLLKYVSLGIDGVFLKNNSELFVQNLNRGLECVSNSENPNELFTVLLFSLLCSEISDFCEKLTITDAEKGVLENIMKNELGMHRNEQDLFFQSLEFIRELQKITDMKKIEDRYKRKLLKNPCLVSSLTLCTAYQLLPEPDLYFWVREYWNFFGNKNQ